MSLIEDINKVSHAATRLLHGETVTLHTADDISTEILDAVVTLPVPVATRDSGPVEHEGTVRLAASWLAAAQAAHTITVRGETWDILTVGRVYADSFRMEINRTDQDDPNIFDLNDEQAVWHDP